MELAWLLSVDSNISIILALKKGIQCFVMFDDKGFFVFHYI